jgi:hypothetical protein
MSMSPHDAFDDFLRASNIPCNSACSPGSLVVVKLSVSLCLQTVLLPLLLGQVVKLFLEDGVRGNLSWRPRLLANGKQFYKRMCMSDSINAARKSRRTSVYSRRHLTQPTMPSISRSLLSELASTKCKPLPDCLWGLVTVVSNFIDLVREVFVEILHALIVLELPKSTSSFKLLTAFGASRKRGCWSSFSSPTLSKVQT